MGAAAKTRPSLFRPSQKTPEPGQTTTNARRFIYVGRTNKSFLNFPARDHWKYVPQPAFLQNVKYIDLSLFHCRFQISNPLEALSTFL